MAHVPNRGLTVPVEVAARTGSTGKRFQRENWHTSTRLRCIEWCDGGMAGRPAMLLVEEGPEQQTGWLAEHNSQLQTQPGADYTFVSRRESSQRKRRGLSLGPRFPSGTAAQWWKSTDAEADAGAAAAAVAAAADQAQFQAEQKFRSLAKTWIDETSWTSSWTDMMLHSAYQQIIGMGDRAVPLLLRALDEEPDHWFWALQSITGDNPIAEDEAGDLELMTRAWLKWGEERGLR